MLHVVCFSHKRELQLHGYLESLHHYVAAAAVTVIYPPENKYKTVKKAFPRVNWTPEGDFTHTLQQVIWNIREPFVMFGCDDVTFVRRPTLEYYQILVNEPHILGYSLRLGSHIEGSMSLEWRWTDSTGHWAYPFDLTATIYRSDMVNKMLFQLPPCDGPNEFEYEGKKFHQSRQDATHMVRGIKCCAINQNVNQVQDKYNPNSHQGTACTTLEQLDKCYAQGRRLDWQHAENAEPDNVWTGMKYWKLTKNPN